MKPFLTNDGHQWTMNLDRRTIPTTAKLMAHKSSNTGKCVADRPVPLTEVTLTMNNSPNSKPPSNQDGPSSMSLQKFVLPGRETNPMTGQSNVVYKAQPALRWIEELAASTERFDRKQAILGHTRLSEPSKITNTFHTSNEAINDLDLSGIASAPCGWDLSFLEQNDPLAKPHTGRILSLASYLEEMIAVTQNKEIQCAYNDAQARLNFMFFVILDQIGGRLYDSDARAPLDGLYDETVQKLQLLLSKVQDNSGPKSIFKTKTGFQQYMNDWLRSNWTNPYPDDDGLHEMAHLTGNSTQVISNWLINARTRKWRPAIVKATSLGRPAHMLLEDSMNLFDNKPLTPLENDEPSFVPQKRSKQYQW